jgi:hypothetical protein
MMLVMFAVGAMNVVWMAALGVLMTIEKLDHHGAFSEASGSRSSRSAWHDRVVGGVGGAMDLNEATARHRSLDAQGRADAVVQLRGVLPLRAVARPERADRRLLPDLGRVRIDEGHFGETDLSGVKFGFMAKFRASSAAATGPWRCSSTTRHRPGRQGADLDHDRPRRRLDRALKILAGPSSACARCRSSTRCKGDNPHHQIEKIVDGAITPVRGQDKGTSSSATANTGSRRTSSCRAPTSRASGCSAATGISRAVGGNLQARLEQSKGAVTLPHSARRR